jgi:hypothetical protein
VRIYKRSNLRGRFDDERLRQSELAIDEE